MTTRADRLTSQSLAPVMGAAVELGTAPNGAVLNKAAIDARARTFPAQQETVQVADNIWVMQSPTVNGAFIVGDGGVIVWESGDSLEDGRSYRSEIRKVTDLPIRRCCTATRTRCSAPRRSWTARATS